MTPERAIYIYRGFIEKGLDIAKVALDFHGGHSTVTLLKNEKKKSFART